MDSSSGGISGGIPSQDLTPTCPPPRIKALLCRGVTVASGDLRGAEWGDIDMDAAEWRYTVTKTNTPHIVPPYRQAGEILRELQPLTGRGRYVFPGRSNGRPMSDNAILAAMRRIGIAKEEMSGHGFRAVARTILDEVLGVRPDYIEHQLAHAVRDPKLTEATKPVAKHPASFGIGTAQAARSRKPMAGIFGRRAP